MIPKIIHYCWLSGDPFPDSVQKCIDSWKKYLPDYQFILWDYNRFPRGKSKWVDQAFDKHKYAFAADYIRLFALYHYGGIYLDADVEVLKSYNDLLFLPYFIGQEKTPSGIEAATMGFEPHHPLIQELLFRYEDRNFIGNDNELDTYPLPFIIRKCIESLYDYNIISNINDFNHNINLFNVFSSDFFSPKNYSNRKIELTNNTYSIHHFEGSWLDNNNQSNNRHKQVSISRKLKKNLFRSFFHKISKLVFSIRNIIIISNGDIENKCCHLMWKKYSNPFRMSCFSDDNFVRFVKLNIRNDFNKHIEFISRNESNELLFPNEYYPIGRIKETNIEIHFTYFFSREQIRNELIQFDNLIKNKTIIYIFQQKKTLTCWDIYKTCLKILFSNRPIFIKARK